MKKVKSAITKILFYFLKGHIEAIACQQVQLHMFDFHMPLSMEQRKSLDKKYPGLFL